MTLTILVVYGLAAWRISSLFVHEDGPADIFKRLRAAAQPSPFLRGLLDCVWCASIWAAMLLVLATEIAPGLTVKVATLFAISALAILTHRHMEVQERKLHGQTAVDNRQADSAR